MKTKKAAVEAADKEKHHQQVYQQGCKPSIENFRLQLGELLFYLQRTIGEKERQRYWKLFEENLLAYLDLKLSGLLNG